MILIDIQTINHTYVVNNRNKGNSLARLLDNLAVDF
ncbi:hypothetical protein M945_1438 [Clostridium saccharobutylicum DSM 13864]|nr:hypothetical protein M945_1438 [Clostridium saccharobutylicum DSM 13864]